MKVELESRKKILFKLFRNIGLTITFKSECRKVNFLGATFSLDTGINEPFNKHNTYLKYINPMPNHPFAIICGLVVNIQTRISILPANEKMFHAPNYNEHLTKAGYKELNSYMKQRTHI